MLTIGEFSKICGVSTKTLRYYAEIGLIHPEEINPDNGYRYYSIRQLKQMLLINRLKSYHCSLDEIKALLVGPEAESEPDEMYASLHLKKLEIQEKMRLYEQTLRQISGDLAVLEQNKPVMSYLDRIEVSLVETQPVQIISIRQILSADELAKGYALYFLRLYEQAAAGRLELAGSPMTLYHSPEYRPEGNDTEFALPIARLVSGSRERSAVLPVPEIKEDAAVWPMPRTRELAGGWCAKSVLKGAYSDLTSVYARMREWMEVEGWEAAGAPYEVYLTDPNQAGAPENNETEVYFPVRQKEAGAPKRLRQ
ncbi:MerR family transcriptional regulator [Paenibacillus sp. CN-4]|uniref:MerR family transcriptional regulator n=1 Tax=Paenibacillus nanchangensis TaxID=3348343 RepID=UPI00397CB8C3